MFSGGSASFKPSSGLSGIRLPSAGLIVVDISSDSSERLALINTLEEMGLGQARDTSTLVTFNALNSTALPRFLCYLL